MLTLPARARDNEPFRALVWTVVPWGLLWAGAVLFLTIMLTYTSGRRAYLPHGQYAFLALCIAVGAVAGWLIGRQAISQVYARPLLALTGVHAMFIPSALLGMTPGYGLRLIALLTLTALPFAIMAFLALERPLRFLAPVCLVSLVCALGTWLLQLYGPFTLGSLKLGNHLHEGGRWSFLFNEANNLGAMMAIGLSASLSMLIAMKRNHHRIIASLAGVIMLYVFLKTDSRASAFWILWSFFVFGLAGLYIVYVKRGRPRHFWPIAGLIAAVLVVLVGLALSKDISGFMRLSQHDLSTGRMHIWELYLAQIKQHVLLGIGFGSTSVFLAGTDLHSPLNVYVGLLGEGGMVGALPFFLLWVTGFVIAARHAASAVREGDRERLLMPLFAIMILGGLALQQNGEWTVMRISPFHYLFVFALTAALALPAHGRAGKQAYKEPGSA